MFEYVVMVVVWCFFIYGLISVIQDIIRFNTYKKIEENIKLIITVQNVENGIENYIREISFGRNFFNNLVVIDMDSKDETMDILRELEKENINMKILNKNDGKNYLEKTIQSIG